MIRFRVILVVFAFLAFHSIVKAQPNWKWPAPPKEAPAKEKYTLMGDDIKSKKFKEARGPLSWLLVEAPDLNKALYQDGAKIYEGLSATETDAKLKMVFQDSALIMYDLRIKYFQDEANVLNRKGLLMLSYWQNRPEKNGEMFDTYKRIIELNKENSYSNNIQSFMYLACVAKNNKLKDVTDEKVIEIHEMLTGIVEKNIAKNDAKKAEWEKAKEYLDQQLEGCVKFDCDLVEKQYEPKYRANPKDTVLASKMVTTLVRGKCTDDPLFFEVLKSLAENAPTFQRWSLLAKIAKSKGKDAEFIEYMGNAFKYGGTSKEKAELYLAIAQEMAQKGNPSGARSQALEAVKIDASVAGKAYSFIGNLYMNSAASCRGTDPKNPCHAKAVFIAAYGWYQKAGDAAGMGRARQYYPTKEDIFTYSMGGQAVNVGCWIGETVTIPSL